MEEKISNEYIKRTQKNYSMSFKLQVVTEVERGEIGIMAAHRKYGIQGSHTVGNWLKKYGTFDWENQTRMKMPQSQEQRLLELEQKVRLLEKQKAFLEHQLEESGKKAVVLDMLINIAEKEYKLPIRKNSLPEQSTNIAKKKK